MAEAGHGVWLMVNQGGRMGGKKRAEREDGEAQMDGKSVMLLN